MKDTDIAYLAGLIDGEGSICLERSHKNQCYRWPSVVVSSTTFELMVLLKSWAGGCICSKKPYLEHHKQCWYWRLKGTRAVQLCQTLLPWLRVPEKVYRAYLVSNEYPQVTPRNGKYSKTMRDNKLDFEHRFLHMSKTWVLPVAHKMVDAIGVEPMSCVM